MQDQNNQEQTQQINQEAAKRFIAALVKLFIAEESLKEEIKDVKTDAKDAGLDVAELSAVAKAVASNKVDALSEKSETILMLIDVARS